MSMGTAEQKLACLKIAAQMNRRINKEDPIPSAKELIQYTKELGAYIRTGWHQDDKGEQ